MAHVVFVRGANAGGKNVFRPARLARDLAHLDVVNVGAAGTFVVRARIAAAALRREILGRLPFAAHVSVHAGRDVLAFVASEPFRAVRFRRDRRGWVAVLAAKPKSRPRLPLAVPAGRLWSVRLDAVDGRFATGMWRPPRKGFVFPSNVAEDALGVRATARWWETLVKVARLLSP